MNVYRIYGEDGAQAQDYIVSVIATPAGASYVYDTKSVEDYRDRIERITKLFEEAGEVPTTSDEWADLAMYNLGLGVVKVLVLEIPEEAAIEMFEVENDEIAFLDTVLIPEREKRREANGSLNIEIVNLEDSDYLYVLVSDDEKVAGLFKNTSETGDVLRVDGEWGFPTFEEIEEWDGFTIITIREEFVDIYDKMLAEGEEVTLEIAKPYIKED